MSGNRVVITGIGLISSLGSSAEEVLSSFKSNHNSFEYSPLVENQPVAPVNNFNLRHLIGRNKNIRYLNRGAAFAVGSSFLAVKDSKIDESLLERAGIFLGAGPQLDITGEFPHISEEEVDWDKQNALWILKFLPNSATSIISSMFNIHGENHTISSACASSLHAIGEAYRKIKDGYLESALAGGGDSRLSKGGLWAYKKAKALHQSDNENQDIVYSPFGKDRHGFIPGEGGACFLLESLSSAEKRGAKIYGEIVGYGATMDGGSMTAPDSSGAMAERAIKSAMGEFSVKASDIQMISAHGTGTILNDEMESNLMKRVFPESKPAVTAFKSWIGHTAAACGALELALTLYCLNNSFLPAIKNLTNPIESDELAFQLNNKTIDLDCALLENFGFGGQNSALVVKKWKQ